MYVPLVILIFCFDHYLRIFEARAEIQIYFCWFWVQIKTLRFAFEIDWPLPSDKKEKKINIRWNDRQYSRAAADAYLNSCMRDMTSRNVKLCTYFVVKALPPETQKIKKSKTSLIFNHLQLLFKSSKMIHHVYDCIYH